MYKSFIKRILDYFFAYFFVLILLPIYLLVSLVIFVSLGRPVIFKQSRPGLNGSIFKLYKFRTMKNLYHSSGKKLSDHERMTSATRLIRSLSLDELPSLYNVIKGEMSFIGPRPLLLSYLDRYSDFQMRRHEVLPGITGWAQVNGRNSVDWNKRFEMDIWYIDNYNFLLDLRIIFLTLYKVITRKDIDQDSKTTMPEFKGDINE